MCCVELESETREIAIEGICAFAVDGAFADLGLETRVDVVVVVLLGM